MCVRAVRSVAQVAWRSAYHGLARAIIRVTVDASGTPAERALRASINADAGKVCHYMTQPLVELYGDCMVVLKMSCCGIIINADAGKGAASRSSTVLQGDASAAPKSIEVTASAAGLTMGSFTVRALARRLGTLRVFHSKPGSVRRFCERRAGC